MWFVLTIHPKYEASAVSEQFFKRVLFARFRHGDVTLILLLDVALLFQVIE